jgi:hypothetical protein
MENINNLKKTNYGLVIGATIITTEADLSKKDDWSDEAWLKRRWGIQGEIIAQESGHGFCFIVRHPNGEKAGYNPEEIISIKDLQKIRSDAQALLSSLNLEISFYNPFNKANKNFRNEPERFLVCFANGLEKRNTAFDFMLKKGYVCKKGKTYEPCHGAQTEEKSWTFQIDLFK